MLELCTGSSTAGGTSPSAGSSIVVPAEGHAGPSVPGGGPDPGPEPSVKRRKRNDAPNSYFRLVLRNRVTRDRHAVTSLDSLWAGGLAHPANEAFASLGSDGLHENNIERDFYSWMRRTKTMVDVPIQIYALANRHICAKKHVYACMHVRMYACTCACVYAGRLVASKADSQHIDLLGDGCRFHLKRRIHAM